MDWNEDGTMQRVVETPVPLEPEPQATDNAALSAVPSCSYTSPWESCAAINDGIDPPQSNDSQNARWGTWPETGDHWIEFGWERQTPRFEGGSPLDGYRVFRDGTPLADLPAGARSYADEGLAEGDTHSCTVHAHNAEGDGVGETATARVPSRPDPPTNVTAVSGAAVPAVIRRLVDRDRDPATAYRYHVTAVNAVGQGGASATSCAAANPSVSQLQALLCG